MVRPHKSPQKSRKAANMTVPVASRTADRQAVGNARGKGGAAQAGIGKRKRDRLDFVGYVVLAIVTIFFLLTVSVPLNNYYSGRIQISRLNESIAAKSAEKERLQTEIEKYSSDSYIEQEARRRLGVVAPGETAFRIIDPAMTAENSVTTDKQAQHDARSWYEVLYDSLAVPPTVSTPAAADAPSGASLSPAASGFNDVDGNTPGGAADTPGRDPAAVTPAPEPAVQ